MEEKRKSEIIIVKSNMEATEGLFNAVRIGVDLPWDRLEDAMGFFSENVLVDITGVLEEIERFKDALRGIKDTQDCINGHTLLKGEMKKT